MAKKAKKVKMQDRKIGCMTMLDKASFQKIDKLKVEYSLKSRSAVIRKLIQDAK